MMMPSQIYSHQYGQAPSTGQGMRMNTKSPGRTNGAPGGNTFAPMTFGGMKQNPQGENYNYSIPSDTFYPMMHGGHNYNTGPGPNF